VIGRVTVRRRTNVGRKTPNIVTVVPVVRVFQGRIGKKIPDATAE
jgi:hypothetical protein